MRKSSVKKLVFLFEGLPRRLYFFMFRTDLRRKTFNTHKEKALYYITQPVEVYHQQAAFPKINRELF
ncbi:hypothetical protein QJ48_02415 [Paenibacillus sp. A3]|nr:hypothetical protein QJ48_02415 [Paenibacillus sp. A3]